MIFAAAIPVGIVAGLLFGGRLEGLSALRLRWVPLAVAGLLAQVVLFSDIASGLASETVAVLYVVSTAVVLVMLLRNVRLTGLPIVAFGALSNLAAIIANGGIMPADAAALAAAGLEPGTGPTNSAVLADPALRPLTDIFAIPASVPLANVFSIGDVLIATGLILAIAAVMRAARPIKSDPG